MNVLLDAVIEVHAAIGFVGLAAFWIPIFTRKGGGSHIRFGRVYAWSAYVVTLSAVAASVGRVIRYQAAGSRNRSGRRFTRRWGGCQW